MSLQIVLLLDPLETSGLTSNNVREFLEKCQVRDIVFLTKVFWDMLCMKAH